MLGFFDKRFASSINQRYKVFCVICFFSCVYVFVHVHISCKA